MAGSRAVIAVVKADGYGHGAVWAARTLVGAGCGELAVATVAEGVELRESGLDVPILVLGGVHDGREASAAAAGRLIPVVHDRACLAGLEDAAKASGRSLAVQVEVDTGMARMGAPPELAAELVAEIQGREALDLDGLYTHLACADETDLAATRAQLERFARFLDAVGSSGPLPRRIHVANSAGLLASPDLADVLPAAVNAVRPGLMLYGVHPAPHLRERARLRPVMTLSSRVSALRELPAGSPVGYGGSYVTASSTRIATLPLGYADGVLRSLASRGEARLGGRSVPFAGRVSMDLVTLDVGAEDEGPVAVGDEAVLFGEGLPVEEVARRAGTLAYEILVRIGPRVPRVVRETGR